MSKQNYSTHASGGFLDNLSLKKRLEMLQIFLQEFPSDSFEQVLDVGVTADKDALSSNYFEEYFPNKNKIIALSNQDATFLTNIYPGLKFEFGDAKNLPFPDNSIDVVFSSAVIEHVGSFASQKAMIAESFRVAKKGVFITTPNRWHPVEPHTVLPFIHWLPKKIHRSVLKAIGMQFYAAEENLNLMNRGDFFRICRELAIRNYTIKQVITFGFVSNLILVIKK